MWEGQKVDLMKGQMEDLEGQKVDLEGQEEGLEGQKVDKREGHSEGHCMDSHWQLGLEEIYSEIQGSC